MARPLTRRDIEPLLVTDADAFTQLRYLHQREAVPAITKLEETGGQTLPGITGAMADLYYSLWAMTPGRREQIPPARRYWAGILDGALKSSAYQELHAQTQLRELQSVLGTIAMGQSVLAMIPAKDQQALQELAEAQAEADNLQNQAAQAQAGAAAMQALADAMEPGQADGQPQPSSGSPSGQPGSAGTGLTSAQSQALAEQASQRAKQAQATADEASLNAEILAEELLGQPGSQQAERKLQELARVGLQAIKDAQAQVEEISTTIESWGLDPAELTDQAVPEALALLDRLKKSSDLKKFAALLGRLRQIAGQKARSKMRGEGVKVSTWETGRDIGRAHPSELAGLVAHPVTRVQTLTRWAQGALRVSGMRAKPKLGHGPVIVCEDASGSMDGVKQHWAKGVCLALADFAQIQRRSFGWVMYDSYVRKERSYPAGRLTAQQKLEIVESRAGGGTSFEAPLRRAMAMIATTGLKKADVVFVTDGDCDVTKAFQAEFLAWKKAHWVTVITVLCDAGGHVTDTTVRSFSDRVVQATSFTAQEAEKLFAHL